MSRLDHGATMVELLTTLTIFGVALGIAGTGVAGWTRSSEFTGSADQLVTFLRGAQQRSLTEAVDYCVTIDSTTTWSMHNGGCTAAPTRQGSTESSAVTITGSFTQFDGTPASRIVFTPRGTATPGEATIMRSGMTPIKISIEGLTGRVASS
jgi:prepilin-type N-terminal cleavage/methylation domain-containing protein